MTEQETRRKLFEKIEQETKDNPELEQGIAEVLRGMTDIQHEISKALAEALEKEGVDTEKILNAAGCKIPNVVPKKDTWTARTKSIGKKLSGLPMSNDLRELWREFLKADIDARTKEKEALEMGVQHTPMEQAMQVPPEAPAIPLPPNPVDGQHGEAHATNNPHSAHATRAIIAAGKDEARKAKSWEGSTLNGNPQYREALPSWGGGAMTTYFLISYEAQHIRIHCKAMFFINLFSAIGVRAGYGSRLR